MAQLSSLSTRNIEKDEKKESSIFHKYRHNGYKSRKQSVEQLPPLPGRNEAIYPRTEKEIQHSANEFQPYDQNGRPNIPGNKSMSQPSLLATTDADKDEKKFSTLHRRHRLNGYKYRKQNMEQPPLLPGRNEVIYPRTEKEIQHSANEFQAYDQNGRPNIPGNIPMIQPSRSATKDVIKENEKVPKRFLWFRHKKEPNVSETRTKKNTPSDVGKKKQPNITNNNSNTSKNLKTKTFLPQIQNLENFPYPDYADDMEKKKTSVKIGYKGTNDWDLECHEGEVVTIVSIIYPGWCFGYNNTTKAMGILPLYICNPHDETISFVNNDTEAINVDIPTSRKSSSVLEIPEETNIVYRGTQRSGLQKVPLDDNDTEEINGEIPREKRMSFVPEIPLEISRLYQGTQLLGLQRSSYLNVYAEPSTLVLPVASIPTALSMPQKSTGSNVDSDSDHETYAMPVVSNNVSLFEPDIPKSDFLKEENKKKYPEAIWFIVDLSFEPNGPNQLSAQVGDLLRWIDYDKKYVDDPKLPLPEKWVQVKNRFGFCGLFPSTYVHLLHDKMEIWNMLQTQPRALARRDFTDPTKESFTFSAREPIFLSIKWDDSYLVYKADGSDAFVPADYLEVIIPV